MPCSPWPVLCVTCCKNLNLNKQSWKKIKKNNLPVWHGTYVNDVKYHWGSSSKIIIYFKCFKRSMCSQFVRIIISTSEISLYLYQKWVSLLSESNWIFKWLLTLSWVLIFSDCSLTDVFLLTLKSQEQKTFTARFPLDLRTWKPLPKALDMLRENNLAIQYTMQMK